MAFCASLQTSRVGNAAMTTRAPGMLKRQILPKLGQYLPINIYIGYPIRMIYDSIATVGEIRVWWRADFQSGSRVLKKVF